MGGRALERVWEGPNGAGGENEFQCAGVCRVESARVVCRFACEVGGERRRSDVVESVERL